MRPRQVEVVRRALAQRFADLPAIQVHDPSVRVQDRHDQRPAQVFVAAVAQHPQRLQTAPHLRPGLPVGLRQAVAQRPVGVAQPEGLDQLGMGQAPALQVGQGVGRPLQGGGVVADHLVHQRRVLGRRRHGRQLRHGGGLHRPRPGPGRRPRPGRDRRRIVRLQQLDRMAEANPLGLHHPGDHVAGRVAAEAAPQILVRRHAQRRRVVLVERAASDPVFAAFLQLHPGRLDQPHQAHLRLQPLDLLVRDSGHKTRLL